MSKVRKVNTDREYNYGFSDRRPEQDIVNDLVNAHNDLVEYIAERDGLVERWGSDYEPAPTSESK